MPSANCIANGGTASPTSEPTPLEAGAQANAMLAATATTASHGIILILLVETFMVSACASWASGMLAFERGHFTNLDSTALSFRYTHSSR